MAKQEHIFGTKAGASMNVLVIDRAPPYNLLQGNALIGKHLFSRLRHHHLTLVCPAPPDQIDYYQTVLAELFDVVHLIPRSKPVLALSGMLEPLLLRTRLPVVDTVERVAATALQAKVAEVLATNTFDVIHTRQIPMASVASTIKHPGKLLELVDSETLQSVRRVRATNPRTWVRYLSARVLEQWAVRQFPVCTTVADADAQMVRKLAPQTQVRVIPNGVDAEYYRPQDLPEQANTIIFTGAMAFPPNVSAVLHFYQHIFPRIRRELPDVRFIVAGRDPAPAIVALGEDPAVTVTGFVDDMRPWLSRASVMVCPMISGSGIKNKVLEALAMARPVVSTTLGIEALDVTDGRELRIANTVDEFAAAVLALLRDTNARHRMAQAGRALVHRRYTWDACAASYDELYMQLARRSHSVEQQQMLESSLL